MESRSNEMIVNAACASAQASFRHLRDKLPSVSGTDASSITMYATDTALVRLRGETICLQELLRSIAEESCHKLPADTHTGSLLFCSRRLIRRRSVVYMFCLLFHNSNSKQQKKKTFTSSGSGAASSRNSPGESPPSLSTYPLTFPGLLPLLVRSACWRPETETGLWAASTLTSDLRHCWDTFDFWRNPTRRLQ